MKYQLHLQETLADGTKRIILEQVDYVHDLMAVPEPHREDAVHEARKSFKRIRAALRLARDEIGKEWYRRENIFYRDASRVLAPVRDSTVLVLTLDAVSGAHADIVPPGAFGIVRGNLVRRHEAIVRELLDEQDVMRVVAGLMETRNEPLQEIPVSSVDFPVYGEGLRRVYRRGRKAMLHAHANPDDPKNFHEWRKRVKYLWHHVDIFRPACPVILRDLAGELHLLSDLLGDAHDLAELKQTLLAEPELAEGEPNLTTLLALIDRRRASLEEATWFLGQLVYCERPRGFVDCIEMCWTAWQQGIVNSNEIKQRCDQSAERRAQLAQAMLAGPELLSTREAAAQLGTTSRTIRAAIYSRRLEATKVGRFWVIRKDSLPKL